MIVVPDELEETIFTQPIHSSRNRYTLHATDTLFHEAHDAPGRPKYIDLSIDLSTWSRT